MIDMFSFTLTDTSEVIKRIPQVVGRTTSMAPWLDGKSIRFFDEVFKTKAQSSLHFFLMTTQSSSKDNINIDE